MNRDPGDVSYWEYKTLIEGLMYAAVDKNKLRVAVNRYVSLGILRQKMFLFDRMIKGGK